MEKFDKYELGDLVYANEDHPHLDVEEYSPGLVVDIFEDTHGAQVEVTVQFYPDNNEVHFANHELTIVGRKGELITMDGVSSGDKIMMVSPQRELVKFIVDDVFRDGNDVDIYGSDVYDPDDRDSFILPADSEVYRVAA